MGKKLPGASSFWCYAIAVVFTNVRKLRVRRWCMFLLALGEALRCAGTCAPLQKIMHCSVCSLPSAQGSARSYDWLETLSPPPPSFCFFSFLSSLSLTRMHEAQRLCFTSYLYGTSTESSQFSLALKEAQFNTPCESIKNSLQYLPSLAEGFPDLSPLDTIRSRKLEAIPKRSAVLVRFAQLAMGCSNPTFNI